MCYRMRIFRDISLLAVGYFFVIDVLALPGDPVISRDIDNITTVSGTPDTYEFTKPYIPPLRTTVDGRLGMSMSRVADKTATDNGDPALTDGDSQTVAHDKHSYWRLMLLAPEKIDTDFNGSTVSGYPDIYADSKTLGDVYRFSGSSFDNESPETWQVPGEYLIPKWKLHGSSTNALGREAGDVFLCQASDQPTNVSGKDQYVVYAITATRMRNSNDPWNLIGKLKLWKTKLTVTVAYPKSDSAYIDSVDIGPTTEGGEIVADTFSEPVVTRDGKLLVFRTGYDGFPVADSGSSIGLDNEACSGKGVGLNSGIGLNNEKCCYGSSTANCPYIDLVYSYSPFACDVSASGWSEIHPVTHAYHDTILNPTSAVGDALYGFAEYPLRAPGGGSFIDNENLPGSYPWIDMDGDNLFFTTIKSTLYDQPQVNIDSVNSADNLITAVSGDLDNKYTAGLIVRFIPHLGATLPKDEGPHPDESLKANTDYYIVGTSGSRSFQISANAIDAIDLDDSFSGTVTMNVIGDVRRSRFDPSVMSTTAHTEEISMTRGMAFAGLWSRGKSILLDGRFNNTDYGLKTNDEATVSLYYDGISVTSVAIANGRDSLGIPRSVSDVSNKNMPKGSLHNTAFIGSNENLFNYNKNLKPVTPRDVVWRMNNGVASDEVAFDDYLNKNTIIDSSMVGLLSIPVTGDPQYESFRKLGNQWSMNYYDGFKCSTNKHAMDCRNDWSQLSLDSAYARVQNAATSTTVEVPDYGQLFDVDSMDGDDPRLEPVVLGGINGRGLWLNGDYGVSYTFDNSITATDLYIGLFLDNRFDSDGTDTTVRTLVLFPDGSSIQLTGNDTVKYISTNGTTVAHTIDLSSSGYDKPLAYEGWTHLGFQVSSSGAAIDFYLNGYLLDSVTSVAPTIFKLSAGDLEVGHDSLGSAGEGVIGWIDDFKIFAEAVNVEVACNHANGTLIRVNDVTPNDTWEDLAASYPSTSHDPIESLLSETDDYACYHDYTDDYEAHLGNIPPSHTSIRDDVLFPEGPLFHNAPRPDVTANDFCLSCHTDTAGPLSDSALGLKNIAAKFDLRRQPMQPPQITFGKIPDNWLDGDGNSSNDPTNPEYIDEWLLGAYDTNSDGDELTDVWEDALGLNKYEYDYSPTGDIDGDTLSNEDEMMIYGSDPNALDSDGDGLNDDDEITAGTSLLIADTDGDGINDGTEDADKDGIVDSTETDPLDSDTDDDGNIDGRDNCALTINPDQVDSVIANYEPDGYGNACDGDLDNDGDVDIDDMRLLIAEGFGAWVNTALGVMPDISVPHINKEVSEIDQKQWYQWNREGMSYESGPSGLSCAGTVPCTAQ